MAPNLEEFGETSKGPVLFLNPLIPPINSSRAISPASVDTEGDSSDSDYGDEEEPTRVCVPLEQNLRELLVKVTGTYDLQSVTVVKLRVIARDVPLQHLGVHTPCLRELILDGSVVSTLRDLGLMRNLKVLRVNRCGLVCLDNMFSFEGLEELYAADNCIKDPIPCAFLTNVRTIDLKRNCLKDLERTLKFLTLCENLEHIHLEGNGEVRRFTNYRQTVKSLLPSLKSLDGITFVEQDEVGAAENESTAERTAPMDSVQRSATSPGFGFTSPRNRSHHNVSDPGGSFTVNFPPRVFLGRPSGQRSRNSAEIQLPNSQKTTKLYQNSRE